MRNRFKRKHYLIVINGFYPAFPQGAIEQAGAAGRAFGEPQHGAYVAGLARVQAPEMVVQPLIGVQQQQIHGAGLWHRD